MNTTLQKRSVIAPASLVLTILQLIILMAGLSFFLHPASITSYILIAATILNLPLGVANLAVSSFAACRGHRVGIFGMVISIFLIVTSYGFILYAFLSVAII